MQFNMHCHQPKMYFNNRFRQQQYNGGTGRGQPVSSFMQTTQQPYNEVNESPTKRVKFEPSTANGLGRGNMATLPA